MRLVISVVVCVFIVIPTAAIANPLALHCGNLFDSHTGKLLGASTVIIDGKHIVDVSAGRTLPAQATRIDLSNQTCLPGLIDSHTHLTSQSSPTQSTDQFHWNQGDYLIRATVYARTTLMAGFTTVRNLGDNGNNSIALRNAINAGVVPGPRIFSAGKALSSTGGHDDPTDAYRTDLAGDPGVQEGIINSPEDAWKAIRLHYKQGADLIKIMASGGVLDESSSADNTQMTLEEITAIVTAAHDYNFTVAAHAHGAEAIRRAVLAGVDSIEHGTGINDEIIALMKQRGTWYVPTIIAGKTVEEKANVAGYFPAQVAAKARTVGPMIQHSAAMAYKAGLKIAFGTDAGVYTHGQNAKEFVYMVEAGIPAAATIQAATISAAELLKHEKEFGSVSNGKLADIIAVSGNPLDDISLLGNVAFVMKEGVVYKQGGKSVMLLSANDDTQTAERNRAKD